MRRFTLAMLRLAILLRVRFPASLGWLERHLSAWIPSNSGAASGHASIHVTGGTWWYPAHTLAHPTLDAHPYFADGGMGILARSLRASGGRDATLSSVRLPSAWLLSSSTGLRVLSGNDQLDRDMSCGSQANRLARVSALHLRGAHIALQRNGANFHHFVAELLPSLIAWEDAIPHDAALAVPASAFAHPLIRMIELPQDVVLVPPSAVVRGHDVTVHRLLPVGYLNRALLTEVAERVRRAAGVGSSRPGSDVIYLTRGPAETRALTNDADALRIIRDCFPSVDVIVPGSLPIEEQVRRLAHVRVLIAPHGAHATNILWSQRLEHYVDISPLGDKHFVSLAQVLGAQAHMVPSQLANPADWYSSHTCDLDALRAVLASL